MPSRFNGFKQLQQRLCRDMNFGRRRVSVASFPLSRMLVDYFERHTSSDYLEMDFVSSLASSSSDTVDPCTLLVAIIFIDRLRRSDHDFFQRSQPSEVYLTALVLAGKYLNDSGLDEFIWNDEWASNSGIALKRVNELELDVLCRLDWRLYIDDDEFSTAMASMEKWIAADHLASNPFLTYNDLIVLSTPNDSPSTCHHYRKSLQRLLYAIVGCTACYLSTLVTAGLVASTLFSWNHHQNGGSVEVCESGNLSDPAPNKVPANLRLVFLDSPESASVPTTSIEVPDMFLASNTSSVLTIESNTTEPGTMVQPFYATFVEFIRLETKKAICNRLPMEYRFVGSGETIQPC